MNENGDSLIEREIQNINDYKNKKISEKSPNFGILYREIVDNKPIDNKKQRKRRNTKKK